MIQIFMLTVLGILAGLFIGILVSQGAGALLTAKLALTNHVKVYPSALAPTYRWHTGLSTPDEINAEFNIWTKRWGAAWLDRTHDEYAWGLVAWGARGVEDQHWLRCWRHLHAAHDRSRGWTVLDEAVDAGLAHVGVEPVAQSCESLRSRK